VSAVALAFVVPTDKYSDVTGIGRCFPIMNDNISFVLFQIILAYIILIAADSSDGFALNSAPPNLFLCSSADAITVGRVGRPLVGMLQFVHTTFCCNTNFDFPFEKIST